MNAENEKAALAGGSLRTDDTSILAQPETIDEFAWRHRVTRRSVHRWIKAGRLIITRAPGGKPWIHGVKADRAHRLDDGKRPEQGGQS